MAALQATKKPPKEGFGQKVKNIVEAFQEAEEWDGYR